MLSDDFSAATERLNAGAEIPQVAASLIERVWEIISRAPRELRRDGAVAGGFGLCDPNLQPGSAEQQVAMMARYALLEALIERGILDEYMADESQRKKVFAAAASFPCNKNDLGEALMPRVLRESPPEVAQKVLEECKQAGYDPDHPTVVEKFIAWMRDHC